MQETWEELQVRVEDTWKSRETRLGEGGKELLKGNKKGNREGVWKGREQDEKSEGERYGGHKGWEESQR